ncbi:MAG: hypothetical protein IT514_10610 [Burkholderiales bacterium]|nr:hypothetical protein [Burkholderiales bacterium]
MNTDDGASLSRGKKALYGLVAPLVAGVVGFWLIGVATHGEGPSVGGRAMVLFLVLFPAGFVAAAGLNTWILFVPLRHRLSAFLLGCIVPALGLVLAYAYQWRIGPFQH